MRWCIASAMLVFLVTVPAGAGGYGGYGSYYRPSYYVPTYNYTPAYYSYPSYSYYPQSYSTYSYVQPSVNYQDGAYHFHAAGYDSAGRSYPSGYYAWQNGMWYSGGKPYYEMTSAEYRATQKKVEYAPGWQKQLLDIAAARDKVEGRLRTNAQEFQTYLQAIKSLGLEGNFRIENYGQSIPLAPYGAPYMPHTPYASSRLGQYGAQGNTLYSYSSIKDLYGDTSPSTLFQQQAKLAENAQSLAGQASTDFGNNVAREGNNRARVAEILAYGQSRKMALDSSHPQIPVEEHREDRIETQGQGQGQVQQQGQGQGQAQSLGPDGRAAVTMPRADGAVTWPAIAIERCASCHGQGKHEGGFEIAKYEGMAPEQKARVWARLTTSDADKRMPRGKDGGPGRPLTPAEFKLFVNH